VPAGGFWLAGHVRRSPHGALLAAVGIARDGRDRRVVSAPQRLHERVRAQGLLGEDGAVVAMVSGGRDSVCLLDVAVAVRGADSVKALHVNYGLRPEADGDERHCEQLCARLEVELEVVKVKPGERDAGNLQAWARELRYAEAVRLAGMLDEEPGSGSRTAQRRLQQQPAPGRAQACVATGHTASDQVETILYRLAASPGRRALLGMAPREGRIVRPLLGVTREQTAAYCRARRLDWREDESNDSQTYARARVRHKLVGALRAVHPAAEANVRRTASLLREETELLDGLVQDELAGRRSIAIARLQELPTALARLVVVRLAEDAAGTYVPQAGDRVTEILALGRRGGRAELHVGGRAGAVIEAGELRMVKLPPRMDEPPATAPESPPRMAEPPACDE
jgi:tRNA(Ile)-lysidine synthase